MTPPLLRPVVAAGAVIWDGADAVLLVRRGRPPRVNEWSIPGGKVEWGEGVEEACGGRSKKRPGSGSNSYTLSKSLTPYSVPTMAASLITIF